MFKYDDNNEEADDTFDDDGLFMDIYDDDDTDELLDTSSQDKANLYDKIGTSSYGLTYDAINEDVNGFQSFANSEICQSDYSVTVKV